MLFRIRAVQDHGHACAKMVGKIKAVQQFICHHLFVFSIHKLGLQQLFINMSALVYFTPLGKWMWGLHLFIFQWQVAATCQYVHLFILYCLIGDMFLAAYFPVVNESHGNCLCLHLFWFAVASGNSDSLPIVSSSRSSSAPSSGRRSKMQFHFDSPHRNQCRLQPDRCVVL